MMKQVQFETSMKNIPLGGNKEYVMQLTQSVIRKKGRSHLVTMLLTLNLLYYSLILEILLPILMQIF